MGSRGEERSKSDGKRDENGCESEFEHVRAPEAAVVEAVVLVEPAVLIMIQSALL